MKKITASILTTLLMLSMVFSSSVFAANEEVSAWDSFLGLFSGNATTTATDAVGVEYRGHIQNVGNFPLDGTWIQGPNQLGTVGQSLRLEGFWIQLTNQPENVNIQYRVHVQNEGWMTPVENGAFAGTEGKSQQIEAIEINLVDDEGNAVQGYSVMYKGHIQNQGDTAWFEDGQQLGTVGSFLRLEALEVKIVQTKADMAAYEAAVAEATALTEADYTAASWAALETALIDNLVTEDNTQAEVDAATAAINAAIDALVAVPAVTGVAPTSAQALTLTFNTAISSADQAKITFAVKRGTTPTTMLAPVWAADGKSVVLARSTNLIAGTYTVTATGIEFAAGKNVATTEVTAQAIDKLEITTSNVVVSDEAQVFFKVYDQYGSELLKDYSTFSWTVVNTTNAARAVAPPADGTNKYFELDTNGAVPCQVGDVLRVTGLLVSDPTVMVTKDITVSNIFTNNFTLGEIVVPEGADRLTQGANWVELTYTATNNYGEAVLLGTTGATALPTTIDGINLMTSDGTIIDQVRVSAAGKLEVNIRNVAGNVTLIALNGNTGTTSTLATTVFATPTANTAVYGEGSIIEGDAASRLLPVTFIDQYGVEMTAVSVQNLDLTTAGSKFNVSVTGVGTLTPGNVSADGKNITFAAATKGTYTLTLTNKTTGAQSTTTVVVGEARLPNQLTVVTAPQTTLVDETTTTPKFKVLDQYGTEVTLNNDYNVLVTSEAGDTVVVDINTPITISANMTNLITAKAPGTDTVTYTLQKIAGAVAIDSQAFDMTVIEDATNFVVTTDKTDYTAGNDILVTVKSENPDGTFYNKYNETQTATVTFNGKVYNRSLAFVNGVATVTIPATLVADTEEVSVDFGPDGPYVSADINVVAAAASKFVLTGTTGAATLGVSLQDNYGNVIDLDGAQIVTITYPAAMSADLPAGTGADGTLVTTFANGVTTLTYGDNLAAGTYTVTFGSYTGTLTLV